jgi:S-adenosylmethionine:tRNA ribosyltransferase-isomerase
MLITDFDYQLPEELIAQEPLKRREHSRMLVVEKSKRVWKDTQFIDFPNYLRESDVLVLNNTKVFPARLLGEKETGARVELFLIRELENQVWETLARPAKRLKTGTRILFGKKLIGKVLEKTDEGHCAVRFESDGNFDEILEEVGKTPLPPYIKREDGNFDQDRERYQTVFAKERGAIAAPTAGLHFTPEVLEQVKVRGVSVTEITLHVGYGTFEPVRVSDLSEHAVAPEQCEISPETAEILNRAKANDSRIIAVGTTTTRALESSVSEDGNFLSGKRAANLTIVPGYKFKAIDGLLTNFHLPQSSLLVLVSTFAGYDLTMQAYRHAVESRYRFYSYGDCMLIL